MKLSSLIRFGVMGALVAAAFVACKKDDKNYTLSSEKEVLSIKVDTFHSTYDEASRTYTFDVDTLLKDGGTRLFPPNNIPVDVKVSANATVNPYTAYVSFWNSATFQLKTLKYLVVAQDGTKDSFYVKINPVTTVQ
jgi:hypothetical protein